MTAVLTEIIALYSQWDSKSQQCADRTVELADLFVVKLNNFQRATNQQEFAHKLVPCVRSWYEEADSTKSAIGDEKNISAFLDAHLAEINRVLDDTDLISDMQRLAEHCARMNAVFDEIEPNLKFPVSKLMA